ncbi:MAG: diguanylate cyclase, partial [Bdellovibrionales bacterium]|nr:diguanylate cyclase [Bdellovibrionales bacterium]
ALEAKEITKGTSTRTVTGSFGIASRIHSNANSIEELIEYADQALYYSKENGRNRFTIFNR